MFAALDYSMIYNFRRDMSNIWTLHRVIRAKQVIDIVHCIDRELAVLIRIRATCSRRSSSPTTAMPPLPEPTPNDTVTSPAPSLEHTHIERLITTNLPRSPIYSFLLLDVRVASASKGHVVCRLALGAQHMNSSGSLHGAVSATIVDWMGGMAIATHDLRDKTGASVDIHVTYQSTAKVGDKVEIEGIAERVGGNLAFTKVNIYKVEGGARGRLVVSGTHTKFVRI